MSERPAPRPELRLFRREHRRATIVVLVLVGIVAFNQITTIAILPVISARFGNTSEIAWVVIAYVLGMAITTAVVGPAIDALGIATALRIAVLTSALGTIGCILAPNVTWLWMARGVQGVGSGVLVAASLAAMGTAFPAELRPRLLAAGALAWAVVSIGSPLVAAASIQAPFRWRGVFALSLVVTIAVGVLGWNSFEGRVRRTAPLPDRKGALLLFMFTISSVTGLALRDEPVALILLITAASGGSLYWMHSSRSATPLLERRHFVGTGLGRTNLAFAIVFGVVLGINAYLPFFARSVLDASERATALTVMPLSIGWAIGALVATRAVKRFGAPRTILLSHVTLVATFLAGFSALWTRDGLPLLIGVAGLTGIGIGSGEVSSQEHLYSAASRTESGRVSAVHHYLRGLAYSYFAAAVGSLALRSGATRTSVLAAFRLAYLAAAVLAVLASVLVWRAAASPHRLRGSVHVL